MLCLKKINQLDVALVVSRISRDDLTSDQLLQSSHVYGKPVYKSLLSQLVAEIP